MIHAMENFFSQHSVFATTIEEKGGFRTFNEETKNDDPYPFRIFKDATSTVLKLELARLDYMIK